MNRQTRIVLVTGEGKGKTTAAMGMVLRAVGHGMRVLVAQWVKARPTGEIAALRGVPNVEFVQFGRGFLPKSTGPKLAEHVAAAHNGLMRVRRAVDSGDYDMVVLDEICFAVSRQLIGEDDVLELLESAGPEMIVVLTGRDAPERLVDAADTVSEVRCVKHGFDSGHPAQDGVEQ